MVDQQTCEPFVRNHECLEFVLAAQKQSKEMHNKYINNLFSQLPIIRNKINKKINIKQSNLTLPTMFPSSLLFRLALLSTHPITVHYILILIFTHNRKLNKSFKI